MRKTLLSLVFLFSIPALAIDMPGQPSSAPQCPPGETGTEAIAKQTKQNESMVIAASAAKGPPRKLELPKLITKGFYKQEQVCEDARKNHPEKKLILVAVKTHLCDPEKESKVCLKTTRAISDPCNKFVYDNFARYHTRTFRTSPDKKHNFEEDPASDEIGSIWGTAGPALVVVDVASCTKLGQVGPGVKPIQAGKLPPAPELYQTMQDQLLNIPGVSDRLPKEVTEADPKKMEARKKEALKCVSAHPEPSLDQTWQALEDAQP